MRKLLWAYILCFVQITGTGCGGGEQTGFAPSNEGPPVAAAAVQTIKPTDDPATHALLGQARDAITEAVLPRQCLSPATPTIDLPGSQARVEFGYNLSQTEAEELLGYKAGAKAKFGLVGVDAKADFSRSLASKNYSITAYYRGVYDHATRELVQNQMIWNIQPGTADWIRLCGDQYNWRWSLGGELYILYRIDFSSVAEKEAFAASMDLSLKQDVVSLHAEVTSKASEFKGRAAVHVEAFQIGGNEAGLGQVLNKSFVDCRIGPPAVDKDGKETGGGADLSKCGEFLAAGIAYAGSEAFVKGMSETPAATQYTFADWNSILPPSAWIPVRTVPAAILPARKELERRFEEQVEVLNRIKVFRSGELYAPQYILDLLDPLESKTRVNIDAIKSGVRKCWDDLLNPDDTSLIDACMAAASPAALEAAGYDPTITLDRLADVQYRDFAWDAASFASSYQMRLNWTTDRPTSTGVRYRIKTNASTPNPWVVVPSSGELSVNHAITVGGLQPLSEYEYEGLGTDQYGMASISSIARFDTPRGNFDVGIIPATQTGCPGQRQAISFRQGNEVSDNSNDRSGWIGAISSGRSTVWRFCRVNGLLFRPLVTSLSTASEYAVIQLGANCPADSVQFSRYFDDEDFYIGDSKFLTVPDRGGVSPNVTGDNTKMYFCMYRYAAAPVSTMAQFPDLGVSYGVFAPSDFTRALQTGWFFTDDEDRDNQNRYTSAYPTETQQIVTRGNNTRIYVARVR